MDDQRPPLDIGKFKAGRRHGLEDAFFRALEERQIAFMTSAFRPFVRLLALRIEMRSGGLTRRHLSVLHGWPAVPLLMHVKPSVETAISRAPDVDLDWVRRHFLHHGACSYFVIPNIYSVDQDEREQLRALSINQLAGVLANLGLIRPLSESELKRFGREETKSRDRRTLVEWHNALLRRQARFYR